jgi:predicted kinase
MRTLVFIMSGISGSGKSTYIKEHLPHTLVVSADHSKGEYRFDPTKLGEAHGQSLRLFAEALADVREGIPLGSNLARTMPFPYDAIVVDNTNLTALELAPYVALANAYGIRPEIITLHVDVETAHARGQHNVPLRTVEHMYATLAKRQLPSYWNVKLTNV